ncbi:hypothetical protein C0W59_20645 [Photobacterium kishitanii]|uniref:sulfatase-like hydrolase/transferase n=1 Tax=Photobacterium kishitanii TaxID=318456 RepID=UPI000D166A9D|nr:sulfatase-like hydrolase/transferase [Photobacterium kishitanii]PSV10874.1 hypothetical protein C0W59_20645 [Photobacterium kishitanii]
MKVLFLFCDMLRAERFSLFNDGIKQKSDLDLYFESFGGTVYKNAFSHIPRTGTSMGMLLSGLLPKNNGCDHYLKYPENFLNDSIENIDSILKRNNYETFYQTDIRGKAWGVIPSYFKNTNIVDYKDNKHLDAIKLFKNKLENENVFGLFTFDDYHTAYDDHGMSKEAKDIGEKHVISSLNMFFNEIDKNEFDYIYIFSDHGNKDSWGEWDKLVNNRLNILDNDRSQIVLFVHKKGDNSLDINDSPKEIIDLLPSLCENIGDKNDYKFDGISIFENDNDRIITFEDTIAVSETERFTIWAARNKNYLLLTDVYNTNFYKLDGSNKTILDPHSDIASKIKTLFFNKLEESTSNFKEHRFEVEYGKVYLEPTKLYYTFSDGTERAKFNKTTIKRIIKNLSIKKILKYTINFKFYYNLYFKK